MAPAGLSQPGYLGQGSSPDRLGVWVTRLALGSPRGQVDVTGSPILAMTVSLGSWGGGAGG